MTPRRLEPDLVLRRLVEMDRLLTDLEGIGTVSAERLESDRLVRHALERILAALVELAAAVNSHVSAAAGGALPTDYRSSFTAAAAAGALPADLADTLAPSAGLRNAIVHTYLDIDLGRIADAVPLAVRDYRAYVRALADWLKAHSPDPAASPSEHGG